MRPSLRLWLGLSALIVPATARADDPPVPIGVATVDVTPTTPIRLVGYGSRKTESEGVDARLKAGALAIGGDADGGKPGPAVLIAVDNLGIPATIADEVAK